MPATHESRSDWRNKKASISSCKLGMRALFNGPAVKEAKSMLLRTSEEMSAYFVVLDILLQQNRHVGIGQRVLPKSHRVMAGLGSYVPRLPRAANSHDWANCRLSLSKLTISSLSLCDRPSLKKLSPRNFPLSPLNPQASLSAPASTARAKFRARAQLLDESSGILSPRSSLSSMCEDEFQLRQG